MTNLKSLLCLGNVVWLGFLVITIGFFSSNIEQAYSDHHLLDLEAEQHDLEAEQHDYGSELNCNPEVDKDGDNIPDNLNVEGAVDWSFCNLYGLDLSNLDLSGANLTGSSLYGADISNTNFSGANLSYTNIYKANVTNTNLRNTDLSYANLCGAEFGPDNWEAMVTGELR